MIQETRSPWPATTAKAPAAAAAALVTAAMQVDIPPAMTRVTAMTTFTLDAIAYPSTKAALRARSSTNALKRVAQLARLESLNANPQGRGVQNS